MHVHMHMYMYNVHVCGPACVSLSLHTHARTHAHTHTHTHAHTHTHQVKKAYGKDIDNVQMQEELARMREYALNELDRNKDSMVSLEEFISYTHGEKFEGNEEWKPLTDEEEVEHFYPTLPYLYPTLPYPTCIYMYI